MLASGGFLRLVVHRVQCRACKSIIRSVERHDMVTCACGKVSVDGGIEAGCTTSGDPATIVDMCEWVPDAFPDTSMSAAFKAAAPTAYRAWNESRGQRDILDRLAAIRSETRAAKTEMGALLAPMQARIAELERTVAQLDDEAHELQITRRGGDDRVCDDQYCDRCSWFYT